MKLILTMILIPSIAKSHCPANLEFISCKTSPCVGVAVNQIGVNVLATCTKVYVKENNKWVFDYYSLINTIQTTSKKSSVMSFESRIYELTK